MRKARHTASASAVVPVGSFEKCQYTMSEAPKNAAQPTNRYPSTFIYDLSTARPPGQAGTMARRITVTAPRWTRARAGPT